MNVKPVQKQDKRIFNTPCKEPGRGSGAVECDCGQHFVASMRDPETEYHAFVDAVSRSAAAAMERIGEPAPFAGGTRLSVVLTVKRPQHHYNQNDRDRGLSQKGLDSQPTGSPSMNRVLEPIEAGLSGIAVDNRNQFTSYDGTKKVYGETDSITCTVTTTRAGEVSGNDDQPELF